MSGREVLLGWLVVCLLSRASKALPRVEDAGVESPGNRSSLHEAEEGTASASANRSRSYCFEPVHGLKVNYSNNELIIRYSPRSQQENAMVSRDRKDGKQRKGIMKKIGAFIMMMPIGLQLMQLPMQLASVKTSLLRSIMVAKIALCMLLLRVLLTAKSPPQKIVVVKAPPKEVHEHFYHPVEEENKGGWIDQPPPWMD